MKINKTLIIALALIAVVFAVSCSKEQITEGLETPNGMKLLSNTISDYTLFIPTDWEADISTGVVSAYNSLDNSNISMMEFVPTYNGKTYTSAVELAELNKADLEATYEDIEFITEPSNIELDGYAAVKTVYTATVTDTVFKFMQVSVIVNGDYYIFTYTALPDNYETHESDVQLMLDTLKFSK